MSKLKLLLLTIFGGLAFAFICHTFWIKPFCYITYNTWNFVTPAIGDFTNKIASDPTTAIMTSGGSIIAVGGLAYKALGSLKDKFSKQVNEITVNSNKQIQQFTAQTEQLQTEKDTLAAKIEELENLPDPTEALKAKVTNLEEQNKTLKTAVTYFTNVQAEAQVLADNKEVIIKQIG